MKKKTLATFLLALCLTAQLNFCSAENNYDEEITLPIGTNFDLEMEEVTRYEYDGNYVKAQTVNGKEQFILQKTGDTIINVVMEDKGQKTELRVLVHIVTEQQFNNPNENQKTEEKTTAAADDKKTAQPNKEIQQQYQNAKTSTSSNKPAKGQTPIAQTAAPNTPQISKPSTTQTPIAQTTAPKTSKPSATQTPIAQTAAPNTTQTPKPSTTTAPVATAPTTTATVKPDAPKQETSAVQPKKEDSSKPLPAIQTNQTFTRPTAQPQTANDAIKYRADQYAFDVLDLINVERTKNNLRPLSMARDLQTDALIRSRELTQRFSHTRPNNTRFYSLMDNPGITRGENIAAGQATPAAVVKAWMNSSVHRENILNPQFTELGVGYYETQAAEFSYYWVQLFRG